MRKKLTLWIEDYLYNPNPLQQIISICLLPLTMIYLLVVSLKRQLARPQYYGIPVVGIGNLLVGGTGKTPVTIALLKNKKNAAVVLRGYGRRSKGLLVVSQKGKILLDIYQSGDEAMLLAKALPNCTIIVSEDRVEGIKKAKELGCKSVFLDDGFSHSHIAKYDILIRPQNEPTNVLPLPSGPYREPKIMYATANKVLVENKDFTRVVTVKYNGNTVEQLPPKLVLITAISKPKRLLEFLPTDTILEAFEDHHYFTNEEISQLQEKYPEHSFITTAKDFVKLEEFKMQNLYLLDLEIQFSSELDLKIIEEL